jgi:5-methylthioadenosine/S-adenosylhomocysteine deaminase
MAELLVRGGDIVTMDAQRTVITNGAVAVTGHTISAVGSFADLRTEHPTATVIGTAESIVTPGYVNAHQHLTGDRLINSCIPEAIDSQDAIYRWAVPAHEQHGADDDELSATIAAVAAIVNGITCTVEAGTVMHPDRVAKALTTVGMRAFIGQWGSDTAGLPGAAAPGELLPRHCELLDRFPPGGLVEAQITLVGHDLMTDELVSRASQLARERQVGLTFHMSPHLGDAASYLSRTGKRPILHLSDLGVLGPHVLIAHGVHLDDAELGEVLRTDTALVSCPWAYLRLAQGFTAASRHAEFIAKGGRLALGCDSENAGDTVDILRAATLFVGLARDRSMDPHSLTSADGFAVATCDGAAAIGKAAIIGSLEVGKRADIVVHSTAGPAFIPRSTDPVRQLMWGSDGRSVSDVVINGRQVVRDGQCITVDVEKLRTEAQARQRSLFRSLGM